MKFLLILIGTIAVIAGAALPAELTGRVVDVDGQALPGVSVVTNFAGVGTETDDAGRYALQLTDDVTRVTFSSVGYKTVQYKVGHVPDPVVLEAVYYRGKDVIVTADRAELGITPVAFENLSAEEIERDYHVGEFPLLLESTPNVYVFNDGGTPLGYSYLKIRGFDDQRIATYINGVPLNDPEDHTTYFTDLPDFAATVTDIQVQRGAGNSLYGDAAFGGAINVVTSGVSRERKISLSAGYGEYLIDGDDNAEIAKQMVEYSSGLLDGRWHLTGRFSKQRTDGYRYGSWYTGWAYYFSIARIDPRMTTELHLYGGPMKMHLAYSGADRETLALDRRANPWHTYDNETDNFNQPHYQLHNTYKISDRALLTNTLYYIRGKGYYEQYKSDETFADYYIDTVEVDSDPADSPYVAGDLVRQKWVTKSQYGWNPRLDIDHAKGRHSFGGSFYYFSSDHWGEVVWAEHLNSGSLDPTHKYYQYFGEKYVGSAFVREQYRLTDRLSTQLTAQLRYDRFSLEQVKMGAYLGHEFDVDWLFFSPRAGINYQFNNYTNAYFNFTVSSRAPNDENIYDADDPNKFPQLEILASSGDTLYTFGDPTISPERVYDFELGLQHRREKYSFGVNLFVMKYENQNVFEGGLDQLDRQITINIDDARHTGVELNATAMPFEHLTASGNFALNYNRITSYDSTYAYAVDSVIAEGDTAHFDETVKIDFEDKTTPGFPDYLGNLTLDYDYDWFRVTWRGRLVGRQYMDLYNIEALSIDPYFTASLAVSVSRENFLDLGRFTFSVWVNNLFDEEYEVSGYGGNYAFRKPGGAVMVDGWAEYFVGAERSFYTQLKLEMF
ncbi:MAG: TonB-dependent receptor [Candidatus Zixiibacteriota bacterium]